MLRVPQSTPALISNTSLTSNANTFRLKMLSSCAFWGFPIILPRYCIENIMQIV